MRKDNQVTGRLDPITNSIHNKDNGTKMSIAMVAKTVLSFHKEFDGLATTKINIS